MRTVQLWGLSPAFYLPVADLADRYEPFAAATVSYQSKNKKNSFYGLDFDAFYGTSVKNTDAIFGGLTDENGNYGSSPAVGIKKRVLYAVFACNIQSI